MEETEILSEIRKCINCDIIIIYIKFMQLHDDDDEILIFGSNYR